MDMEEIKNKLAEYKANRGPGRPSKEMMEVEKLLEEAEGKESPSEEESKVEEPKEEYVVPEKLAQDPPEPYEVAEEAEEKAEPVAEDRSAYNCEPCKGEGITFPPHKPGGVICLKCQGTGKN